MGNTHSTYVHIINIDVTSNRFVFSFTQEKSQVSYASLLS
uniref:Uncharacterized protein n=1 Tax=Rhizophora mucronata TaxID=61149 RepID=A0A2P2N9V5_RHIMU